MSRDPLTRRSFVRMAGIASVIGQSEWLRAAIGAAIPTISAPENQPKFAFVGAKGQSEGIHVYAIDGLNWSLLQIVRSEAPVSLALHPTGRTLFVLNEVNLYQGLPTGAIEAYGLDYKTGKLELLNRVGLSLSATMPRHLAVAPDGGSVVVAVHGGGAYNLLPILEDGQIGRMLGILKETGSGPVGEHQETAHPQSVVFDSTGRRIIAADLGSDRVSVISAEDGLEVQRRHAMPAGTGPSHLALHPAGHLLYVDHALDGSLSVFVYDAAAGMITERLSRTSGSRTSGTRTSGQFGSALALDAAADILYTAGRSEIGAWRFDAATGNLNKLHSIATGNNPVTEILTMVDRREILAITPRGILRMDVDLESGQLGSPSLVASVDGARCCAIA